MRLSTLFQAHETGFGGSFTHPEVIADQYVFKNTFL
tara:strand:- start:158 stop:265 length:108 start_codon:yes stop_codon:yes gene_type:complete